MPVSDLHRQIAALALAAAGEHGFALGGGNALLAHGVISRPTLDAGLFTGQEHRVQAEWATKPSTSRKRSAPTGRSSPAAASSAPARNAEPDEEWDEFLGHFQRRRLPLGDCGRAWGTSCIHEQPA